MPVTGQYYYLMEAFSGAIEFGSPYMVMDNLKKGLEEKNDSLINKSLEQLKEVFADIHNKDYDHEVDRKVAKAIFPVYAEIIPAEQRPAFYQDIEKEFKGDYNAYIDAMYDNSILANQSNFDKFIKKPTVKAIEKDLATQYSRSQDWKTEVTGTRTEQYFQRTGITAQAYIRGVGRRKEPVPSYPDS